MRKIISKLLGAIVNFLYWLDDQNEMKNGR